jgi:chaperonin GroES
MKIRPLFDLVIIKRKEEDKKTKGGLYIPDSVQEKPAEGEVLAVGPGRVLESGTIVEPSVKVSDVVLFSKGAFVEIKVDGEEYVMVREDAILAVLT